MNNDVFEYCQGLLIDDINFFSTNQQFILKLISMANTIDEVDNIVRGFGSEAKVIRDMLFANMLDSVTSTDLADEIIERFKKY